MQQNSSELKTMMKSENMNPLNTVGFTKDEQKMFKEEKSNFVKVSLIKLKCVIALGLTVLAVLQCVFIITSSMKIDNNTVMRALDVIVTVVNSSRVFQPIADISGVNTSKSSLETATTL